MATNDNINQGTTSAVHVNIELEDRHSSSEAESASSSPPPPPYIRTIGDIQQHFGPSCAVAVEGATSPANEKIVRDILDGIRKYCNRRLLLYMILGLPLLPLPPSYCMIFMYWHNFIERAEDIANDGIRHVIRLEGEQWSRYVIHIRNDGPECLNVRHGVAKKLIARGYGYVLVGLSGLLIDQLATMSYTNQIAVRSEFIRAPNGIDMMLRVWFCKRVYRVNWNNDPYTVDIFLPSEMTTDELSDINKYILHESKCRPIFDLT
ncbi:unnamed protein product [Rotaria socialis]|uniref:Uncharacterized protein n=2 Tax=Rotaria socialis TaxID=392032 RepID=A0A818A408_9BILA|nr:unnamed protein product [Rotaria socialis]